MHLQASLVTAVGLLKGESCMTRLKFLRPPVLSILQNPCRGKKKRSELGANKVHTDSFVPSVSVAALVLIGHPGLLLTSSVIPLVPFLQLDQRKFTLFA